MRAEAACRRPPLVRIGYDPPTGALHLPLSYPHRDGPTPRTAEPARTTAQQWCRRGGVAPPSDERRDGAGASADDRLVTVVGRLADLTPGEAIVARGWWHNDRTYGWQFRTAEYRTTRPATPQGMKKYLGSDLVRGVRPVNAARIVEAFGEATFRVIDADPERLRQVLEIGPVRASRIAATGGRRPPAAGRPTPAARGCSCRSSGRCGRAAPNPPR